MESVVFLREGRDGDLDRPLEGCGGVLVSVESSASVSSCAKIIITIDPGRER